MLTLLDGLYGLVLAIAGPPVWLVRRCRGKRGAPLGRRLGGIEALPLDSRPVLWIHAVSVGEVLCARGLVQKLCAERPDLRLLITSTTQAGLATARRTWPDLAVREAPLDLSFAIRRFLHKTRPIALVLVELELWPQWLAMARRAAIPVYVVNAKVSARSARGYARLERLGVPKLSALSLVLAQEEAYAARFRAHGVAPERVTVTGNLKGANTPFQDPAPIRRDLRALVGWAPEHPVLVAGSTHPGEEDILLAAQSALRREGFALRLVLAPRHLERTQDVVARCRAAGLEVALRSSESPHRDPAVLILDTLGELARWYAVGEVAFVGGTFAPVGGHNPLEPLGFGLPILVGPTHHTILELVQRLSSAGCLAIVPDPEALSSAIRRAATDLALRRGAALGARRIIAEQQDALDRTYLALTRAPGLGRAPLELPPHG